MQIQVTFRVAITYYIGDNKRRKVARVKASNDVRAIEALKYAVGKQYIGHRIVFEPEDIECEQI